MGQFLSTQLDWVYVPSEKRWRLGLASTLPAHFAANDSDGLSSSSSDDDDDDDDTRRWREKSNSFFAAASRDTGDSVSSAEPKKHKKTKHGNKRQPPFVLQHSARNERNLSMLYFALVQAFCHAGGAAFNDPAARSSAATLLKRVFEKPLVFTTGTGSLPMQEIEGGLGSVDPKAAVASFLAARNFAPAFAELEGDEDIAGTIRGGVFGGSSTKSSEQARDRALARRLALLNVQNAATTVNTAHDATKFAPYTHYLEVADAAGKCCYSRQSDTGAVVFDCLDRPGGCSSLDGTDEREEIVLSASRNGAPTAIATNGSKPHTAFGMSLIKETMVTSLVNAAAQAEREREEAEAERKKQQQQDDGGDHEDIEVPQEIFGVSDREHLLPQHQQHTPAVSGGTTATTDDGENPVNSATKKKSLDSEKSAVAAASSASDHSAGRGGGGSGDGGADSGGIFSIDAKKNSEQSVCDASDWSLNSKDAGGAGLSNESLSKGTHRLGNQVTCHSLHHLVSYLALVASNAAAQDVEFSLTGEQGEAVHATLWDFAQQSPGFIKIAEHHQQRPGRSASLASSFSSSGRSKVGGGSRATSPKGHYNLQQQQQQQQQRGSGQQFCQQQTTFTRQPVFALRSLVARCGMSLFPPRGTAEARRLAASEEADLFFTAVGSQMVVEACSRVVAFQALFQPFLSMSFGRTPEGDLDTSRYSFSQTTASQHAGAAGNSATMMSASFSSLPLDHSDVLATSGAFGIPSGSGATALPMATSSFAAPTTPFSIVQKLLSSCNGFKSRLSPEASETAKRAILTGRLLSAVANAQVHGVVVIASGATLEVACSTPRTLLAVTRELRNILEQQVKLCPRHVHPGEYLLRELLDSCFFDRRPLLDQLVGPVQSRLYRSILGSQRESGSLFKLLFGLMQHVPLTEHSNKEGSGGNSNDAEQEQQVERDDSTSGENDDNDDDEPRKNNNNNNNYNYNNNNSAQQQQQFCGSRSGPTLEQRLLSSLGNSPCRRRRNAPNRFTPSSSGNMSNSPQQQQSSAVIWKEDDMARTPADYVNHALQKVVEGTTQTSNAILNRIKEVSHVLNNTKKRTHMADKQQQHQQSARAKSMSKGRFDSHGADPEHHNSLYFFDDSSNLEGVEEVLDEQQQAQLLQQQQQDEEEERRQRDDPKELAALLFASQQKAAGGGGGAHHRGGNHSDDDDDDWYDEDGGGKKRAKRRQHANGGGLFDRPVTLDEERQLQTWERAIDLIQAQARMATRIAPHPLLSTHFSEKEQLALLERERDKKEPGKNNNSRHALIHGPAKKEQLQQQQQKQQQQQPKQPKPLQERQQPKRQGAKKEKSASTRNNGGDSSSSSDGDEVVGAPSTFAFPPRVPPVKSGDNDDDDDDDEKKQLMCRAASLLFNSSAHTQVPEMERSEDGERDNDGDDDQSDDGNRSGSSGDATRIAAATALLTDNIRRYSVRSSSAESRRSTVQVIAPAHFYSPAERLLFSKTLLFFVAAMRELDNDIVGNLHFMNIRTRAITAAAQQERLPVTGSSAAASAAALFHPQRAQYAFAEAELLRQFAVRSSVAAHSAESFSAIAMPKPCAESLRVEDVELLLPPVTAAFGAPRVRPLGELRFTIRDRPVEAAAPPVPPAAATSASALAESLALTARGSRRRPEPPSAAGSPFSSSFRRNSFSSGSGPVFGSSQQQQQQHQRHAPAPPTKQFVRVCIYRGGVLLYPDQRAAAAAAAAASTASGSSAAPSLYNALHAVHIAHKHRSRFASSHESTLLSQSGSMSGGGGGGGGGGSTLTQLARAPNRLTADALLLLGATHFLSLHELILNLVPDGHKTWDALFRMNTVTQVMEQQQVVAREMKQRMLTEQKEQQLEALLGKSGSSTAAPGVRTRRLLSSGQLQRISSLDSSSGGGGLMSGDLHFRAVTASAMSSGAVVCDSMPRASALLLRSAVYNNEHGDDDAMTAAAPSQQHRILSVSAAAIIAKQDRERQLLDKEQQAQLLKEQQRQQMEVESQQRADLRASSLSALAPGAARRILSPTATTATSTGTAATAAAGTTDAAAYNKRKRLLANRGPSSAMSESGMSESVGTRTSGGGGGGGGGSSSAGGVGGGYPMPRPIFIEDYSPTQLHHSSMLPVLLAPRLHGEPLLRAFGPPLFYDTTTALKLHAEFLAKSLVRGAGTADSASERGGSGGGGISFSAFGTSVMMAASSSTQAEQRHPLSYPVSATEANLAWSLGTRWFISSENSPSPIAAMLTSTLMHRPVLGALSKIAAETAGSMTSSSKAGGSANSIVRDPVSALCSSASTFISGKIGGGGGGGAHAASSSPAGHSMSASSAVPPPRPAGSGRDSEPSVMALLRDNTVWDKVFRFLDPPKYGQRLPTPARQLYSLALLRDLTHALDGLLLGIPIDGLPLAQQVDELEQANSPAAGQILSLLENNFARALQNGVRLACNGATPHRVFSRVLSVLAAYTAVCSAHFSRLDLWPSTFTANAADGVVVTPLHRLLWTGLSFIDLRGLLAAVSSRANAVLGALLDYQSTDGEDALIIAMTDAATVGVDDNNNNNNTKNYEPSSPTSTSATKFSPSDFLLDSEFSTAANPEFLHSLKLSGAHETAALVVTCAAQLIAVTASASSDIARRWVHGVAAGGASVTNGSAALAFLDQLLGTSAPELRTAFFYATLAWRAICLLSSGAGGSGGGVLPRMVTGSPYADFSGSTVAEWSLPASVLKAVASNAVAQLTLFATSILPDPTVASLLSLVATIHRIVPAPGPLFSGLRLDRPLASIWDQLTVRHQQLAMVSFTRTAGGGGGGGGGGVGGGFSNSKRFEDSLNNTTSSGNPGGGAFNASASGSAFSAAIAAAEASVRVPAFDDPGSQQGSFRFLGGNTTTVNSGSSGSGGASKSSGPAPTAGRLRRDAAAAADMATEIVESELFLALTWATAVAEDSLSVPAVAGPWAVGLFEHSSSVGTAIPPVVEKLSLSWSPANPYSRIVAAPKLPGSCSLFHLAMMRSFERWLTEPSATFVGQSRYGAPFVMPMWMTVVERMVPNMLAPRLLAGTQATASVGSVGRRGSVDARAVSVAAFFGSIGGADSNATAAAAAVAAATTPSSRLISGFDVSLQFVSALLRMLSDARDAASEVLIFDCTDLDVRPEDPQQQQLDSGSSTSTSTPTTSQTPSFAVASALKAKKEQQQQQQQQQRPKHVTMSASASLHKLLKPQTDIKDAMPRVVAQSNVVFSNFHSMLVAAPASAGVGGSMKAASAASVAAGASTAVITQNLFDVVTLASSFAALVPALDVLLIPHALHQCLKQPPPVSAAAPSGAPSSAASLTSSPSLKMVTFGSMSNAFSASSMSPPETLPMSPSPQQQQQRSSNLNNSGSLSTGAVQLGASLPLAVWGAARVKTLCDNASALFPDLLYTTEVRARMAMSLGGCLECVTALRTVARVVQSTMLHFPGEIKSRINAEERAAAAALAAQQQQQNEANNNSSSNPNNSNNSSNNNATPASSTPFRCGYVAWPFPDWTRTLTVLMSLLEAVVAPAVGGPAGPLSVLRATRGSGHLIAEVELAVLTLASHAATTIGSFSQLAPVLSFFLVRYAQPRGLTQSDAELPSGTSSSRSNAAAAALLGTSSSSSSFSASQQQHHASNAGSNSNNNNNNAVPTEATESAQQMRALRVALLGVVDAVLQRASVLVAEAALQGFEDDAASYEVMLTQHVRELVANGIVSIAQHAVSPTEPRNKTFRFSKFPVSAFLSSVFSGGIDHHHHNHHHHHHNHFGGAKKDGHGSSSSPAGGGGLGAGISVAGGGLSSSSASSPSSSSSAASARLVALTPPVECLAGKNYETDRCTAIVFLQRLLVLARRVGTPGTVLQEYARRSVSGTMLAILDAFNSKRSKTEQLVGGKGGGAAATSSGGGGFSIAAQGQQQLQRVPSASMDNDKTSLELVADALLSTIQKFSDEVLHATAPKSRR